MVELFILGYILVAVRIGMTAAYARRPLTAWAAVAFAGCLPAILWFVLNVRDAIIFDRPLFDLVSESGRFGFFVGGALAIFSTPVWLLAGWIGLRIGARRRGGA